MASKDAKARTQALRRLLEEGELSTQEELREELEKQDFEVTQSTISRDLRRLGAIKGTDSAGQTVYRLSEESQQPIPIAAGSLQDLILQIDTNGTLIVIHTHPGSASLIARRLDQVRPAGILGTIAGDDTIFVAPAAKRDLKLTLKAISECL